MNVHLNILIMTIVTCLFTFNNCFAQDTTSSDTSKVHITSAQQLDDFFNTIEVIYLKDRDGNSERSLTIACGLGNKNKSLYVSFVLPEGYIRYSFRKDKETDNGNASAVWFSDRVKDAGITLAVNCSNFGEAKIVVKKVTGIKESSFVKIQNASHNNLCLNLERDMSRNGGIPNMFNCKNHPAQEWFLVPLPDGFFKIKSRDHEKCLNLQTNDNQGLPSVRDCGNTPTQEWKIDFLPNGQTNIINRSQGKCLNLQQSDAHVRGIPTMWECTSSSEQEWSIYHSD